MMTTTPRKRTPKAKATTAETPTDPQALVDEPTQADPGDGWVIVPLVTANGAADLRVPPADEWTAVARHALNREDTLTWAQYTLSPADALTYMRLNPTMTDDKAFFEEWGRRTAQAQMGGVLG